MATIERLRRRSEFLAAAEGRRFHTERMTAQGLRREAAPEGLRIGFTITKRVGHATERNRIRRRLRAAVAAIAPDAPAATADVVLIARRPALSADFETLKTDLARALAVVTRPRAPREPGSDASRPERGQRRGKGERSSSTPRPAPGAAPSPNASDGTGNGQ